METPIFYAPPESRTLDTIELSPSETRHAVKVLRLRKGSPVLVVDGLGTAFRGELARVPRAGKAQVSVHAEIRNFGEPLVHLTLAMGLSTGFKLEAVVTRGTELGVTRFVPLLTEKSTVKPLTDPKRAAARARRLEKVTLAAIKQCRRAYRPDVSSPRMLSDYLWETEPDALNLIFHPSASATPFDQLTVTGRPHRATILVGPEAGFSARELADATDRGFRSVSVGKRILRAETAAPVLCALVMNALGELR